MDARTLAPTSYPWPRTGKEPMGITESNANWDQLAALRDDLDRSAVVVPICVSRIDGKRHELSPKAMRFAEALSFSDAWSRISEARSRRLAA
jgi:hypothetical protein